MRPADGLLHADQQTCSRCNMSHQQFIDNGKPRCPGRPHTDADLWPDIRVKPRPDDSEWMRWAQNFTQTDSQSDGKQAARTRERLRAWTP